MILRIKTSRKATKNYNFYLRFVSGVVGVLFLGGSSVGSVVFLVALANKR